MKIRYFLPLVLALLGFGACKSTSIVENSDTGNLRGNAALIDANGDILSHSAGITVQIQGTQFQATSNDTGDWQINNVPAGIYNVQMFKPGFDTLSIPQYQFSGAGTSFLMNCGIQAIPMDSLIFTLENTVEEYYDSAHDSYLDLLSTSGTVSGPDSLEQGKITFAYGARTDSATDGLSVYIINNTFTGGDRGFSVPSQYPRGTLVTARSYTWAHSVKSPPPNFIYPLASSPFFVQHSLILP